MKVGEKLRVTSFRLNSWIYFNKYNWITEFKDGGLGFLAQQSSSNVDLRWRRTFHLHLTI